MRIVLVNTHDLQGGAARAAHRLLTGLTQLGHESRLVVRFKTDLDDRIIAPLLVPSKQASRRAKWIMTKAVLENRTPISNTHFSLPEPSWDIGNHPEIRGADILNLHWIADFISLPSLAALRRAGLPMVWTLHDQRPMTGGCHYAAGCDHYQSDCGDCPQIGKWSDELPRSVLSDSIDAWGNSQPALVCPSRWLANCARQSALFKNARIEVIPNGLDTTVFKPQPPQSAREELGLPESAVLLLFGADAVNEKRKGIHALKAGLHAAMEHDGFRKAVGSGDVVVASFGDRGNELPELDLPIRNLGRVTSDTALARLYSAVDAVLLPSLEDNLPNVMVEAMCCGTPVIGHNVGGIPEVIEDGRNGLLVPADNPGAFASAVCRLALNASEREQMAAVCREEIPPRFGLATQANQYLALFQELISGSAGNPGGRGRSACPPGPWGRAFYDMQRSIPQAPSKRSFLRRLLDKLG